jgi:hypothetical protein
MQVVLNRSAHAVFALSTLATEHLLGLGSDLVTSRPLVNRADLTSSEDAQVSSAWGALVREGQVHTVPEGTALAFRSHPDLIHTVRALGEKAHLHGGRFDIVEVPDQLEARIRHEDVRGYRNFNEWVEEVPRRWGVAAN